MKCLLYSQEPTNINDVTEHYVTFHRADPDNWFFKNLFECKNEIFRPTKCLRSTDFIATLKEKDSRFYKTLRGRTSQTV